MTSAIIGLASRLPGARDLSELWDVLIAGACTVSDGPKGRWLVERFFHPNPAALGFSYSFAGGYLDDPLGFDPLAFGISPREAAQIDPQQRLLLELVWEALEDAGIPPSTIAGDRVGVYVGASNVDYQGAASVDQSVMESHFITGISLAIASNRISYTFDLKGPSLTVDTACSSSIVALDAAVRAIEAGEIDTAIVAGVNMLLSPIPFIGFSRARMLSPTGRSRPFSAKADGYVRSEGGAAMVVRRLDVARRSADTIRSVILGTGVNSDGRTVGVSLPSVDGQASLLAEVYERSEVAPSSLAFLEAHGTGTPVGDPIEARAIGESLGQKRDAALTIGSVKSNIGHLESASGAAAIAKVVLSLEKGIYPRTLHLEETNPNVHFEELNLLPATEDLAFGADLAGSATAGICNYGFGGTNAHVILRSATTQERATSEHGETQPARLLMLSAHTREALSALASTYSERLQDEAIDLDTLARASARQRDGLKHRLALPLSSRDNALAELHRIASGEETRDVAVAAVAGTSRVALVFPGNGAQWAGMGVAAYRHNAEFAQELRAIDTIFQAEAGWSLIQALHAEDIRERLAATSVAQPLIYAIQSALAGVLVRHGLKPNFVLGHSVGEIAAAEASGALTREAAVRLVRERSQHQEKVRGAGGMMAIATDEASARDLVASVGGGLEIAALNAPSSFTVVGSDADLKSLTSEARKQRIATIRLGIDYPFHSALLDDIRETLLDGVRGIRAGTTSVPFISSVTGAVVEGQALDAEYWWRNIRNPVQFQAAVECAAEAGATLFIELSPRPILVAAVTEICRASGAQAVAIGSLTERSADPERDPVLALLAMLVARGVLAPSDELIGTAPTVRVPLPHYPWQKQLCILPKTTEGIEAYGRIDGGQRHPLIGTRLAQGSPEWRMLLDAETVPYLADHQVGGEVVVPGAALVEMALAVGRELYGDVPLELTDIDILRPLILPAQGMREISVRHERSLSRVEVWSRPRFGNEWTFNAGGRVNQLQGHAHAAAAGPDNHASTIHGHAEVYKASARAGLQYGPSFQRVERLRRDGQWLDAVLSAGHMKLGVFADTQVLDPTALDAAFHGLFVGLEHKPGETRAFLPVRIRRLRCWRAGVPIARALIQINKESARSMTLQGWLLDQDDAVVAEFEGVYLRAAVLARVDDASRIFDTWFEMVSADQPTSLPAWEAPEVDGDPSPSWLLTRAIAIASAHEAVLALAIGGRIEVDACVSQGLVHPSTAPLLGVALRLLEAAQLASEDKGIWKIADADDFPAPARLISALAERFPEAQAELVTANAVSTLLGEQLRTGEARLAPEVQRQFWSGASILHECSDAILDLVGSIAAASFPRPPRIAIIEPSAQIVHDTLRPLAQQGRINLVAVTEGKSGSSAPWLRSLDLADNEASSPTAFAAFDGVVGLLNGALPRPAALARLASMLGGTCSALIGTLPHDDALDLMLGLGEDWLQTQPDHWFATGAVPSADMVASAIRNLGLGESQLVPGSSGGTILTANRAIPAERDQAQRRFAMAEPSMQDDQSLAATLLELSGAGSDLELELPLASDRDSIAGQARASRIVERLRELSRADVPTAIWVVTRDAFARNGRAEPQSDAIWSFVRVAMNEFPAIDIRLVDIASSLPAAAAAQSLLKVVAEAGEERELLISDEGIFVPRVQRSVMAPTGENSDRRRQLRAEHGAGFEQFAWHWADRRAPGGDEVEITVDATGLNFRDVMVGMGLLDEGLLAGGMSAAALGFECAGTVVRVGPQVEHLAVGDKVMGFAAEAFASHVTSAAASFSKVPAGLSAEAAATIPVAFSTAWFALMEVARLRAGETVLIHGAVGGVGQAAMQIAKLVGAKIIATAGNPERRKLALALGADAVYESRSLDFAERILSEHGGVDVVLNSLAGEAMKASFRLLRPFGRFIELGKRDFLDNTALELRPFVRNLSYFGVDLDELLAHDASLTRRILDELTRRFESGDLKPVPYRLFAGEDVSDAMRLMQRSGHVGKIVVRPALQAVEDRIVPSFKPKPGPFVVLGGAGGFGLETAIWLADRGASQVVVASRRGHFDASASDRLGAYAGRISVDRADATDPASVTAFLARVREKHGPLSGVIHTAMVLEDGLLDGLTDESLARVVLPKAVGVTVLDEATRSDPLQCFVAFSSATTLIGSPGQGAYVLANAYLEGLMRQRRLAGVPALAVGWGAIADAGVIARDSKLGERLARTTGVSGVPVRDALRHLGQLLARGNEVDPVQIYSSMGNSAVAHSLAVLKSPAFVALSGSAGDQSDGNAVDLQEQIVGKTAAEALEIVLAVAKSEIGRILRIDADAIDPRRPLSEIGMDSLMALELRLGVEKRIGVELPLMSLGDRSASHVAEKILEGLLGTGEVDSEAVQVADAMALAHGADGTEIARSVMQIIELPKVKVGVL